MVKRRKVLFGIGAVAAGGAAATATGAFSHAQMDRDANIDVVNDENGLVALKPNDEYSETFLTDGGELKIDFASDEGGEGVNVNSRYQVGSMWINNENLDHVDGLFSVGNHPGHDPAFEVINQDSTEHDLTLKYEATGANDGSLVYIQAGQDQNYDFVGELSVDENDTEDSLEMNDLGPGEKFGVSIFVDTRDGSVGDGIGGTLTVTAD